MSTTRIRVKTGYSALDEEGCDRPFRSTTSEQPTDKSSYVFDEATSKYQAQSLHGSIIKAAFFDYPVNSSALEKDLAVSHGYQCLYSQCKNDHFCVDDMRSHLIRYHSVPEEYVEDYVVECRDVALRQKECIASPVAGKMQYSPNFSSVIEDAQKTPKEKTKVRSESWNNKSLGLNGPFWGVFKEDQVDLPRSESSEGKHNTAQSVASCGTESDSIDTMDGSSDDYDMDVEASVEINKEHVLSCLMVYVHDMFSPTESTDGSTEAIAGSSTSAQQAGESSTSGSNKTRRKRGRDESNDDRSHEDDEEDGSKNRKKARDEDHNEDSKKSHRKLACPYYKHDPHACHSSKVCCGPGWDSIHRIKAHLYRVHAMPLHCRRCYAIFASEALLNEHSRTADSCERRDEITMDGFNKDQERALKCRKDMFRANTEEEKWKTVYLILFPDTGLGEMPSPYYELHDDHKSGKDVGRSPTAPELQEFDAYLKRELPRTIRKNLQAALESKLGPIAETLKNELESIVRDAQETLTQSYLRSTQLASGPSGAASGHAGGTSSEQSLPENRLSENSIALSTSSRIDALSQYIVPPEAASTSLPALYFSADATATGAGSSTSAHQSLLEPDNSTMDDPYLNTFINDDDVLRGLFAHENIEVTAFDTFDLEEPLLQDSTFELYTGKGKEPDHDNTWTFDFGELHEGPT